MNIKRPAGAHASWVEFLEVNARRPPSHLTLSAVYHTTAVKKTPENLKKCFINQRICFPDTSLLKQHVHALMQSCLCLQALDHVYSFIVIKCLIDPILTCSNMWKTHEMEPYGASVPAV